MSVRKHAIQAYCWLIFIPMLPLLIACKFRKPWCWLNLKWLYKYARLIRKRFCGYVNRIYFKPYVEIPRERAWRESVKRHYLG